MFFLTFIRTQGTPFECLPILVRDSQFPKSASQMYIRLVFPMKITAARGQEPLEKLDRNKELMEGIPFSDVKLLAPIPFPRQDVICLGINYYAHAEEAARFHDEAFGGERPVRIGVC